MCKAWQLIFSCFSLCALVKRCLRNYLKENGKIIIGDVAFETRKDLEECKLKAGDTWDNDEIYFVIEELRKDFPALSFTKMSDCAGVLILD